MRLQELTIAGAYRIEVPRFSDHRGHFSVIFNCDEMEAAGLVGRYIQENQSFSAKVGTLRGLHGQHVPYEQTKLVRVLAGRAMDVIVDARPASNTFGQSCLVELTAERGESVYVPRGCLHGFLTLEPNTVISYHVDNQYAPQHERSVAWDDPELAIDWKPGGQDVVLSDRDAHALSWQDFRDELASFGAVRGEGAGS